MDLKVYNYKVLGLEKSANEIIEQFKISISSVKGVKQVEIDGDLVKCYADEWTSEYDIFSSLNEICGDYNFELDFEDGETDETEGESEIEPEVEVETNEVVKELQTDGYDEDDETEEEPEKKGKITKGDIIEKCIIFLASVVLLVIGLLLGAGSSARSWLLMLSFTVASYETLYDVIIKITEKKYFVEEIVTFIGALIFTYLGYSAISAVIMLLYGVIPFASKFVTSKMAGYQITESEFEQIRKMCSKFCHTQLPQNQPTM